jgi:uncharacterized membrane protein YeaQ/YmgE (transglycosylase-associated protein family)
MNVIWFLLIGAVAGWLAGLLTKGKGFGVLGNIIVGVVGAVIGGHLFQFAGVSVGRGLVGSLVTALIGALVLLFVINLIRKG